MNCEETVWETCTAAGIGGHNMLILVMLARENDSRPDGGWLTKREIACRAVLSTSTVRTYLQSLYDAGHVARRSDTGENGASLPTLYRVNMTPGQVRRESRGRAVLPAILRCWQGMLRRCRRRTGSA